MSAIEFIWNGNKTIIQTTENEKISEVVKKFFTKAGQNLENMSFLYGGQKLNLESTFSEAATSIDFFLRICRSCIFIFFIFCNI